ncbi:hypothetical protein [Zhongshania aliphaticivorans]|uniref:hypothetical protein n=1 Tax=Zhongshania aliphaticivorans TaxID=1470434 RepID=UPI0012E6183F|nr:hypothetical protein [Zhongshania aliphaticivorans]CAA0106839.1 Uncharacterised protein [Zhongshania aliphaticivorans]
MLIRTVLLIVLGFSSAGLRAQSLTLIAPGYFDSLGLNVLSTAVLLPVGIAGDAPVPGIDVVVGGITQIFGVGGPIESLGVAVQGLTTGGPLDQGLDQVYALLGGDGIFSLLLAQSPIPFPLSDQSVLGVVGLDSLFSVDTLTSPLSGLPSLPGLPGVGI